MWKVLFLAAALGVSASPLDAAPRDAKTMQKGELRRDIERISKEIYPPPPRQGPQQQQPRQQQRRR
jgi:hypothetical protein